MAASQKVHVISTKYFMCINWGYYVIFLKKQEVHIINTLARRSIHRHHTSAKAKIMIPYYDEIVNQDYIGPLGCIPNEPKIDSANHQTRPATLYNAMVLSAGSLL